MALKTVLLVLTAMWGVSVEGFKLPQHPEYRVLIIDSGSSGSRANYYILKEDAQAPLGLKLDALHTEKVKPGISSYVRDIPAAVAGIRDLMLRLETKFPLQTDTELSLQATAGMRIVQIQDPNAASAMMNEIRKMLQTTFGNKAIICSNCVRISSGIEEGLYSYLALNYLLNNDLENPTKLKAGLLEIGGASMQLVLPKQSQTVCIAEIPVRLQTVLKSQCAFAKSYLPFGSDAVRHGFFNIDRQCVYSACNLKDKEYSSPCFHSDFKEAALSVGATTISVRGTPNVANTERFDKCHQSVQNFLTTTNAADKPAKVDRSSLLETPIYLIGGSINTLTTVGYTAGQQATTADIEQFARSSCATVASRGQFEPYDCINLVYLSTLLRDIFQFPATQKFVFQPNIDQKEVTWALGAALESVYHHTHNL